MRLLLCHDRTSTIMFMRHWACATCAGASEALSDPRPAVAQGTRVARIARLQQRLCIPVCGHVDHDDLCTMY